MKDDLTDSQELTLQVLASFCASLSLVGTSIVLVRGYRQWKQKKQDNVFQKASWCLAFLDFVSAAFEIAGPSGKKAAGFCELQGFGIQTFVLASVLWHPVFVSLMYAWLVQRNEHTVLLKRVSLFLGGVLFCSSAISIGLAAADFFGPAIIWCWIRPERSGFRFGCFYLPVVIAWIVSLVMSIRIIFDLERRLDTGNSKSIVTIQDNMAYNAIRKKLMAYIVVFVTIWLIALLNRLIEVLIYNETLFFARCLHVSLVPLQGFLNSVIYGGLYGYIKNMLKSKRGIFSCFCKSQRATSQSNKRSLPEVTLREIDGALKSGHTKCHITLQESKHRLSVRELLQKDVKRIEKTIFVTTFNMGESSAKDLGDLNNWIPKGHDIYVVGLQEALAVDEIRREIHVHLGLKDWVVFKNEIGSSKTEFGYHGFICLSVFAKVEDVERGVFCKTETANRKVHQGVNVGVGRAGNKGAVGLPFRYYDTTLAFITAHFASDSKGRKRLHRRNLNAQHILRDAVLTEDRTGFDAQLQHHHMILMGDLNYRLDFGSKNQVEDALQMVVSTATAEKALENDSADWRILRYQQLDPSQPGSRSRSFSHYCTPTANALKQWQGDFQTPRNSNQEGLLPWEGDWTSDEYGMLMRNAKERWQLLFQHEELTQAMERKDILYGFQEQNITFPPSFRRKRGQEGDCGDYTDLERLKKAFTTHIQEDSGKKFSIRVPSYTDRILVHTLENCKPHIHLGPYELCDAVTCSDHRPVSLLLKVDVNPDIEPEESLQERLPGPPRHRRRRSKRQSIQQNKCEEFYFVHLSGFKVEINNKVQLGELNKAEEEDFDTSGMDNSNASAAFSRVSGYKDTEIDMEPAFITTIFPIPTEDPLASRRKLHRVASAIDGNKFQKKSLLRSQSTLYEITLEELLNTTHSWTWSLACTSGLRLFADARAAVGLHVLVKIQNAAKQSLGQGVICLTDAEGNIQDSIESKVSLTMGGTYVGSMSCTHHIKRMHGAMA